MPHDVNRLKEALLAADKAGDTEAATALARALRVEMRIQSNPAEYDSASPEFQGLYGPTAGMTSGQKFRAGIGRQFYETGRGAKQLTGNLSRQEVDERRAMDAPLLETPQGAAGNVTGALATALPTAFVPGLNTYRGATLVGAGLGALQPVGEGDSRGFNVALGAGGGALGKYAGDKIVNALTRQRIPAQAAAAGQADASAQGTAQVGSGRAAAETFVDAQPELRATGGGYSFGHVGDDASAGLTEAQRQVMNRGRDLGMRVTPGQATGSRALQQMEAKLESQPMTSGPFNTIRANNQRVLARETAASIGETADSVDDAVIDRAFTRLADVFENAGDDVSRSIDPQNFLQRYSQIQDDIRGLVSGFGDHPLVSDLINFAQAGQATGRQLQSLTSKLGKAAYKQMSSQGGDRDLGIALYQVKDYVDELLQQGMSAERAATFQRAREQYRNLIMLTSRVGVVNPSSGSVSGRSLANLLQSKDRTGFTRGRNRSGMYDAARFAQAFPPIVGDSGTATRMPLQGVTDMLARIPLNIATRAYTSTPAVNLAMAAQAASRAGSRAITPMIQGAARPFGTVPYYSPYLLPGAGGLLAPQLAGQ